MSKQKTVSETLRDALKNCDRSVYELAKEMEIAPDPLYRFLKGKRDLRLETASKLCEVLGLRLVAE